MKNSKTLLLTILSTITLGVASLGAISSIAKNNDPVEVAEAAYPLVQSDMYRKVTSKNDVHDEDQILIVADNGQVVDAWWGNPAYCHTTSENVYYNGSDLLVLNNAYVAPFTVHKVGDYFTFKGSYTRYHRDFTGYLGWDNRGSSPSNPGPNDWTNDDIGIGYFKDYFALRKSNSSEDTHFTLNYTNNHMVISNRAGYGNITWTSYYSDRLIYGEGSNVNIYKKAVVTAVSVANNPTKCHVNHYTYTAGDLFDLSGLEVDVHFGALDYVTLRYDDNPYFFEHSQYVTEVGEQVTKIVSIRQGGANGSFNVIVDVLSSNGRYYPVNDHIYDGRSKFMFVINVGTNDYRALSFHNGDGRLTSVTISSEGYINTAGTTTIMQVVYLNSNYYIWSTNDEEYVSDNGAGGFTLSTTPNTPITFDYTTKPVIKNGDKYLCNNGGTQIGFNNNSANAVDIYRLEYTPSTKMDNFMDDFRDLTSKCDYYGLNNFITTYGSTWSDLSVDFDKLDEADQVYIHNLTYTHNAEVRDSYPDLIDRYDYILAKYDAFDFMERKTFGSYEPHYHSVYNPIVNVIIKDSILSITLIVAVTFVLTGTALFFYLKKRKQHF